MVSVHFDTQGLFIVLVVLIFAMAGYVMLWDYVDNFSSKTGNLYAMAQNITSLPLRIIATILAIILWPFWSFAQILMMFVMLLAAIFVYLLLKLVAKPRNH